MILDMRVMLDADTDVAYVQLAAEWEPNPDGFSVMLLPPEVPSRVDLFFTPDQRLELVRVEQASGYLDLSALASAVPFEPFE